MRIFGTLMIVLMAAGCQPASLGEKCPGLTTCAEGSRCFDGTCTACGAPGQICCSIAGGHEVCNGNVACVGATYGFGQCQGECGQVGLPCCGNECYSGTCYLGSCTGGEAGDECYDPSGQPHTVYVIDSACASIQVNFSTKTPEQAEKCRQALVSNGVEVCALDQIPTAPPVCGSSELLKPDTYYFEHCSDAQLELCEKQYQGYQWTPGACP
jgi:hypothetical protein